MTTDEDSQYLMEQLLDSCNNLWVGKQFASHLRGVLARLPLPVLEKVLISKATFFAPDPLYLGRVFRFDISTEDRLVVYLSPKLLSRPPAEIQACIAHELAHVALGHEETLAADADDERAADQLAESWGFPLPDSYKNRL